MKVLLLRNDFFFNNNNNNKKNPKWLQITYNFKYFYLGFDPMIIFSPCGCSLFCATVSQDNQMFLRY